LRPDKSRSLRLRYSLRAWSNNARSRFIAATPAHCVGVDTPFDVNLPVVNPRIGPGHTHLPPAFVPQSAQEIVDEIARLAALGVTWTSVARPKARDRSFDEHLENLQWIAEEVVPACR